MDMGVHSCFCHNLVTSYGRGTQTAVAETETVLQRRPVTYVLPPRLLVTPVQKDGEVGLEEAGPRRNRSVGEVDFNEN